MTKKKVSESKTFIPKTGQVIVFTRKLLFDGAEKEDNKKEEKKENGEGK